MTIQHTIVVALVVGMLGTSAFARGHKTARVASAGISAGKPEKGWVALCDDETTGAKHRRKDRKRDRIHQHTQIQQPQ